MFQFLHNKRQSIAQLVEEELYSAQCDLIVAEAEVERAEANVQMLRRRVKRLTTLNEAVPQADNVRAIVRKEKKNV